MAADDAACNERFPELAREFEDLYARLGESAETVSLPHPRTGLPESVTIGQAELAGAIRLLSYHPSTIALLPLLIHKAANGNFAPITAQFLMSMDSISDALAMGMHNAVVCTEDMPYLDRTAIDEEALASTYIGTLMVESLETICSVWPSGVIDDGFHVPLATDKPVLLLSGDADPITPPAYAEQAAVDLENAAHLIGRNQGHGMAPRGCVPDIMADFVADAAIGSLDTDCLDRLHAMPFFLEFSGPAP